MFGLEAVPCEAEQKNKSMKKLPVLYEYSRPKFIRLSADETDKGHDHLNREILYPKDSTTTDYLPWNVGYAEVINAGKSDYNEDQAWIFSGLMISANAIYQEQPTMNMLGKSLEASNESITVVMFGICDGHAGWGAAMYTANTLQVRILEKLEAIKHFLFQYKSDGNEFAYSNSSSVAVINSVQKSITIDDLIVGALEEAFVELDAEIKRSQSTYYISGGCTSIAVVFLLGRIFTANAGDCRSILVYREKTGKFDFTELSNDHTPHSDRQRMQSIAYLQPELLGQHFGRYEMQRRARRKDVEKKEAGCHTKLLFRDAYMKGWAMKDVNQEDVNKIPMVIGKAKRARLLSTIGTTRGLGDHDLTCQSGMYIKPFLSAAPDVSIYNLHTNEFSKDDVIVLASDGLWESLTNLDAVENITKCFTDWDYKDNCRYRNAAIELVRQSRGESRQRSWRTPNDEYASMDDITCFVIPIHLFSTIPIILSSVSNTVNKGVDPIDFLDVNIPALNTKLFDGASNCNFMDDGVMVQLDSDQFEDPGIQTII